MTTTTASLAPPTHALPASPRIRAARVSAWWELTKPRMNLLVLATTAVGAYLAAGAAGLWAQPWVFVHLMAGTALTAAGASVLNQWVERDHDALMPRTRRRPLPAGRVPASAAGWAGVGLATVGPAYLYLLVSPAVAALGLFTVATYVLLYTPLKRRTVWCTLVGAVPGAIPPVMGYAAFADLASAAAWSQAFSLFAVLFVWQMPHFYGLAILYRDDYRAGGYAMLPCVPGGMERTTRQTVGFCLLLLGVGLLPTATGLTGPIYGLASLALGGWFLWAGVRLHRDPTRAEARRVFVVSILYLPILMTLMMLDRVTGG